MRTEKYSKILLAVLLASIVDFPVTVAPSFSQKSSRDLEARYLIGEVISVDAEARLLCVRETVRQRKLKTYRFRILPSTRITRKGMPLDLRDIEVNASVTIQYVVRSSESFEAREVRVAEKWVPAPAPEPKPKP